MLADRLANAMASENPLEKTAMDGRLGEVPAKKRHRDLFLAVRKCINLPRKHLTELPFATAALFRPLLPRGLADFRFLAVKSPASSFWK